jgi:hypothetical protein
MIDGFKLKQQGQPEDFHTHAIYAEDFENITIKSFEGSSLKSDEDFPAISLKKGNGVTLESCKVQGELYEASDIKGSVQMINPDRK